MDPTDDMIMTLQITVDELKKGIIEYSNKAAQAPEQSKAVYYDYVKEMHQIALLVSDGIKGLEKLRDMKNKLMSR